MKRQLKTLIMPVFAGIASYLAGSLTEVRASVFTGQEIVEAAEIVFGENQSKHLIESGEAFFLLPAALAFALDANEMAEAGLTALPAIFVNGETKIGNYAFENLMQNGFAANGIIRTIIRCLRNVCRAIEGDDVDDLKKIIDKKQDELSDCKNRIDELDQTCRQQSMDLKYKDGVLRDWRRRADNLRKQTEEIRKRHEDDVREAGLLGICIGSSAPSALVSCQAVKDAVEACLKAAGHSNPGIAQLIQCPQTPSQN